MVVNRRPYVDALSGARLILEQNWRDRQRSCVRHSCAAVKMAAGRYGDARFGSRTKLPALSEENWLSVGVGDGSLDGMSHARIFR